MLRRETKEGENGYRITDGELSEQILLGLKDLFCAEIGAEGNRIEMKFANGQTFAVTVTEA